MKNAVIALLIVFATSLSLTSMIGVMHLFEMRGLYAASGYAALAINYLFAFFLVRGSRVVLVILPASG